MLRLSLLFTLEYYGENTNVVKWVSFHILSEINEKCLPCLVYAKRYEAFAARV